MAQVLRPDVGELEVRIEGRPETVFEFFIDPEKSGAGRGARPSSTHARAAPTARLAIAAKGGDPGPDPWSMQGTM